MSKPPIKLAARADQDNRLVAEFVVRYFSRRKSSDELKASPISGVADPEVTLTLPVRLLPIAFGYHRF